MCWCGIGFGSFVVKITFLHIIYSLYWKTSQLVSQSEFFGFLFLIVFSVCIFWLYLSNQKWKANLRRRWQCLLYDDDNIGRDMQCILYIRMKIDSGDIFRYPIPYHLHTIAMILGKTHMHRLKNETPLWYHNIIAEQDGCHKVKLETWL